MLLSGALMVLVALGVIVGIWMDLAALGLAILVLIMAFVMHRFWDETDPQTKRSSRLSSSRMWHSPGAA